MSTGQSTAGSRPAGTHHRQGLREFEETPGFGWIVFAGCMIAIVGVLNVIYGIGAISKSSFYVANTHFVFSELKTWGWIVTAIGAFQIVAAWGIWAQHTWARWTGVAMAGLNAIAQLMFIPAYPWLSLALFAVDVLVIYGLVSYGGRLESR